MHHDIHQILILNLFFLFSFFQGYFLLVEIERDTPAPFFLAFLHENESPDGQERQDDLGHTPGFMEFIFYWFDLFYNYGDFGQFIFILNRNGLVFLS